MTNDSLPLIGAAAKAGVGYLVMRDLVLRQKVRGWQDKQTRRWYVDPDDLQHYLQAREANAPLIGGTPQEAAGV